MSGGISPGPWHWETWEPEWKPDGSRLLGIMDKQRDFVFECECESGGLVMTLDDEKLFSTPRYQLLRKCLADVDARKDLFHRLWSNAGSTKYDKDQWMVLEAILLEYGVFGGGIGEPK